MRQTLSGYTLNNSAMQPENNNNKPLNYLPAVCTVCCPCGMEENVQAHPLFVSPSVGTQKVIQQLNKE